MNPLETLTEALDSAQNELKSAEIEYLNAQVRVQEARTASERLEAAVAALKGDISAPSEPQPQETGGESAEGRQSGSRPDPAPNPYGHLKCSGCGEQGKMFPGKHNMLVCQACGNMVG